MKSELLFIVSQPRSGSTLLQAILSNHQDINTASEPWLLLPFLNNINNAAGVQAIYNHSLAKKGILNLLKDEAGISNFKKETSEFLHKIFTHSIGVDGKYILDKTPRYYEILDEILDYFPNAKILLLKRDPANVFNSIINTWVKKPSSLHHYYRDLCIAPFKIHDFQVQNQKNPNVRSLCYEELTQNPQKEVSAILNWLCLDFDPALLDYSDNSSFRGNLGDQSENIDAGRIIKTQAANLPKHYQKIREGYLNFLGNDFLKEYGNYNAGNSQMTPAFRNFEYQGRTGIAHINFRSALPKKLKSILYSIIPWDFLIKEEKVVRGK